LIIYALFIIKVEFLQQRCQFICYSQ
jgi:hypothetical protein